MNRYSLNGAWSMRGNGYDVKGNIPGSVYSFLHIDNHILPDPFYRDNENIYTELCEHEYSFEREFDYSPSHHRIFIVFEGLDTLCSVYINGIKIGETDNMHIEYRFDITSLLKSGANTICVVCHPVNPYMKNKNAQSRLFGATDCMEGYPYIRKAHSMMGWDWGARLPDAGIWRSVYLLEKDSAEIVDADILQRHENGNVFVTPVVKTDISADIRITMVSPDNETFYLPANTETKIESPLLWWPNGMGESNLYKITVELLQDGKICDKKEFKTGLRDMKLIRKKDEYGESFYHEINGADMFAMGADYIPEDNIFSRITEKRTRELLTHCKNCNFNAIRVWGGGYYPDDYFFDICDELGIVVFFDLMFACSVYEPDDNMKASIRKEVIQNLSRIRHHACIGLICGNNEIEWHFDEYVELSGRRDLEHLRSVYLELFEEMIPEIVHNVAPYIPYIPSSPTSSGAFNDPNGEGSGDCHFWEFDQTLIRERYFRYMSEFGAISLPDIKTVESFTLPQDRNVNSRIMEKHQRNSSGNEGIMRRIYQNYLYPTTLNAYIYASQLTQAETVKYIVEHLRRNRGRCMASLYWQVNDIWPCTSFSSIDYFGRYKALQYFAKRFYSPVLISCEETGDMQTKRFINAEKGVNITAKTARLCVTNDTADEIRGKITWQLRNAKSDIICCGEENITVAPRSAKAIETLVFDLIDVYNEHLYFAFEADSKILSEGSVLFAPAKYHEFEEPKLEYDINGNEITVRSNCYAKNVQIYCDDEDILLSDNFFDMEKGEKRVTLLCGDPKSLKLRCVYDIH